MQANVLPYADLKAPLPVTTSPGSLDQGLGWRPSRRYLYINRRHHVMGAFAGGLWPKIIVQPEGERGKK